MIPARSRLRAAPSLLAVLALALAVTGCGDDEGGGGDGAAAEGRQKVTVVLDWSPNTNHAGVYLAQAEGWYAQAGLDVEIIEPGDAGSLALLGTGKADVAFTAQEELVPARAGGMPVVGIAAVIEHNTSSLLSLAEDGITRPRDLAGKRYGGFGGPLEEALVRTMVSCDGGDPDAVRFAEIGEADYRAGLTGDQYDAVWIFDGWDGLRLREIDQLDTRTLPLVDYERCIPDWYTPLLATNEDQIAQRPEVLSTFMAATARGYRQAMAEPQAAADALLAAVPELDRELVESSSAYLATRYASDPAAWGRMDDERWTEFVAFLVEAGLIEEPIDVPTAFTARFLPEA